MQSAFCITKLSLFPESCCGKNLQFNIFYHFLFHTFLPVAIFLACRCPCFWRIYNCLAEVYRLFVHRVRIVKNIAKIGMFRLFENAKIVPIHRQSPLSTIFFDKSSCSRVGWGGGCFPLGVGTCYFLSMMLISQLRQSNERWYSFLLFAVSVSGSWMSFAVLSSFLQ